VFVKIILKKAQEIQDIMTNQVVSSHHVNIQLVVIVSSHHVTLHFSRMLRWFALADFKGL